MIVCLFCIVSIVCLACPAFAAEDPAPLDGFIYVGSFSFASSDFSLSNGVYSSSGFSASGLSRQDADVCAVSFADQLITLDWYSFTAPDGVEMAGIGNLALYDAQFSDNGYGFGLVLCKTDKSRNTLTCTSGFYDEYVSSSGSNYFTISFAVPEVMPDPDDPTSPSPPDKGITKGLFSDVTSVFNSAMNMVGSIATTVISHPILYLPIVIGLCGIGVAFFNRLKQ